MKTNEVGFEIEKQMNSLFAKAGIQVGNRIHEYSTVGCKYCSASRGFFVILPATVLPIILKVRDTFKLAGFSDILIDEDPINDAYVQISACAA